MPKLPPGLIISISGVRGIADQDLDSETIRTLTRAYIALIGPGKFIVGGDSRSHTPQIKKQVIATLLSLDCDVVDAGIQPTPTINIAIPALKARGGIVVTASHNPGEYNGLKFFDSTGHYLNQAQIDRLIKNCSKKGPSLEKGRTLKKGIYQRGDRVEKFHLKKLKKIASPQLKGAKLKVLIDLVNGAGCDFVKKLARELGIKFTLINANPQKPFPHLPEPNPENLKSVSRIIKNSDYDIGFATDPDCDRIVILSPQKGVLSEEYTLALSVKRIIQTRRPGKIIINCATSLLSQIICQRSGFEVVRAPVGENNVYERMQKEKTILGGEGNGGVMDPRINSTRDSFTGLVHILSLLAEKKQSLDEIVDQLPRLAIIKEKVPIKGLNLANLAKIYSDIEYNMEKSHSCKTESPSIRSGIFPTTCQPTISREDGIWLGWPDRWVLFRPSNTEPIARLIAEAPTRRQAQELIDEIKTLI